jgi:outer membrane immunogenic protein
MGAALKKIVVLASAVAALGFVSSANAADMPVKAPAMIAPVYNWTGWYAGANAGGSWGRTTTDYTLAPFFVPANATLDPSGFTGGIQAGYNWQMNQFVFGIEGDIDYNKATASQTLAATNGIDFTTANADQRWFGTLRGRLGIAQNNWLFYATGGVAFLDVNHSYFENRPSVAGANRLITGSTTKAGYAIGGGVEYGMGRWTLGAEYLYMGFANNTLSGPVQTLGGVPFPADSMAFKDSVQVARLKLNYRFGAM